MEEIKKWKRRRCVLVYFDTYMCKTANSRYIYMYKYIGI